MVMPVPKPIKAITEKPVKAIWLADLKVKSGTMAHSANLVVPATFEEKKGFYKKLSDKYPELLAKMSVAASLDMRASLGDKCAEDRLVFDEKGILVGTFSFAIEDFKPFRFYGEDPKTLPKKGSEREEVLPSTETLIKHNVTETLLNRGKANENDEHPHNLGVKGSYDNDMCYYWFTNGMKPRPFLSAPPTTVKFSCRDFEDFPILSPSEDQARPFHWPTYEHPGENHVPDIVPTTVASAVASAVLPPKFYADPNQFRKLAGSKIAHEQKMLAAMKILLTYQPQLMKKRLEAYFGNLTLDYSSLDKVDPTGAKKKFYAETFPQLCNPETNKAPFVDFMMKIYQLHYDSFYRAVVFYAGCKKNIADLALDATAEALYNKPSYYKDVLKWVEGQNKTLYKDDPSLQYNEADICNRYHQIWRDTHTSALLDVLKGYYTLASKVYTKASNNQTLPKCIGKKPTDTNVTTAWQLIESDVPEISIAEITAKITVQEKNGLRPGLLVLCGFINSFRDLAKAYYQKECTVLTEKDNADFARELQLLNVKVEDEIAQHFSYSTTYAKEFDELTTNLKAYIEKIKFQRHLNSTDEVMAAKKARGSVVDKVMPHTDESIIKEFNGRLFLWAKGLKPAELTKAINKIIDEHYTRMASTRFRGQPVKEFLKLSAQMPGDSRLAYILSSGTHEGGKLNTALIKYLAPQVLAVYPIKSISDALDKDKKDKKFFDYARYTSAAVAHAKKEENFLHTGHTRGSDVLYTSMYKYIDALDKNTFEYITKEALKAYKGNLSYYTRLSFGGYTFWDSSRQSAALAALKDTTKSQSKIIMELFAEGADTSDLNKKLFKSIISKMQFEKTSPKVKKDEGELLIVSCTTWMQDELIQHSLKDYAKKMLAQSATKAVEGAIQPSL